MIDNKPSIYNAQSVYNQGGGGGTFDVDIGGGVSQTLVFPPYLQPVEYIDTSNVTEDQYFGLLMAAQIPGQTSANDYTIKCVFQPNESTISNNQQRTIFCFTAPYMFGDTYKEISLIVTKDSNKNTIIPVFGTFSPWLETFDFSRKISVVIDQAKNSTKIYYDDSLQRTVAMGATPPSYNLGNIMLCNYQNQNHRLYKGKLFYVYIKNSSGIVSLLIPARAKDPNDAKPYIVDAVSGAVAINCSINLNVTGVEFGPDIDLFNEIPGWIT